VLSEVPGRPPRRPLEGERAERTATAIAALHRVRVSQGPRLRCGSSPTALRGLGAQTLRAVTGSSAVTAGTKKALAGALEAAAKRAVVQRHAHVRTLCHGDLRLWNLHDDGQRVRFIDLEHSGIGDPAVDLLLFRHKAPLDDVEELALLDAYTQARKDPGLLDRYFALRPLVAVTGAIGGLADLLEVQSGRRPITSDVAAYVARRKPAIEEEIARALDLALAPRKAPRRPARALNKAKPARKPARLGRVAIDGTAASGKSIIARGIAARFSVPHYNTGALYRLVALIGLTRGLDPARAVDIKRALALADKEEPALTEDGALYAGGRRREEALYVHEVDEVVATWASAAEVRAHVGRWLLPALAARNAVVEGRDAGTVLLPRARHRFFVDADPAVRAQRTRDRLGRKFTAPAVRRVLDARDRADRERALAPMVAHDNAVHIDTTRTDERQTLERVLRTIAGES